MIVKCYFGECRSDSRHSDWESMKGVFFSYVPKPKTQPEKCAKWVQAYSRKDLRVHDVKKDAYICTLHFVRLRTEVAYHTPQGFELNLQIMTVQLMSLKCLL